MSALFLNPVFVVALLIILDQAAKYMVVSRMYLGESIPVASFFHITYAVNTGVAFSMFQGANTFFAVFTLLVISGFAWWYHRYRAQVTRLQGVAAILVLAGAVGNLIDRVFRGHVVDFLDVRIGAYHWPAFNVADSCISVGGLLLFWLLLRHDKPARGGIQQR